MQVEILDLRFLFWHGYLRCDRTLTSYVMSKLCRIFLFRLSRGDFCRFDCMLMILLNLLTKLYR